MTKNGHFGGQGKDEGITIAHPTTLSFRPGGGGEGTDDCVVGGPDYHQGGTFILDGPVIVKGQLFVYVYICRIFIISWLILHSQLFVYSKLYVCICQIYVYRQLFITFVNYLCTFSADCLAL